MRRMGLVCLAIGLIVVPPAIYVSSQARADAECQAGEYVCTDGDSMIERQDSIWIESGVNPGINVLGTGTGASGAPVVATQSSEASSANYTGVFQNDGTGNASKYGVYATSEGNSGYKYGLSCYAGGSGNNFGLEAYGNGGDNSYGVYAVAYSGSVKDTGIHALAAGSVLSYGLKAQAAGTGTNYGIHATASGGTTNYAGYFAGDVEATGDITSGGDITAGASSDFRYASAREYYFNAPSSTCLTFRDDWGVTQAMVVRSIYGYSYIWNIPTGGTSISTQHCPIHLPQDAYVTEFQCKVYDNDSSGYVEAWLVRTDTEGSIDYLANVSTSSQSASIQTLTDDTISYNPIDNSSYNYYVRVVLDPSAAGTDYIRYYNCRITVEVSTLGH